MSDWGILAEDYGDNRAPRYVEHDIDGDRQDMVIHRASSLGSCARAIVIWALDVQEPSPAPEWLQIKFTEGNWVEKMVLDEWWVSGGRYGSRLFASGIELIEDTSYRQIECDWRVGVSKGRDVVVRCHPDAVGVMVQAPETLVIVEVKGFA